HSPSVRKALQFTADDLSIPGARFGDFAFLAALMVSLFRCASCAPGTMRAWHDSSTRPPTWFDKLTMRAFGLRRCLVLSLRDSPPQCVNANSLLTHSAH